MLLTVDRIPLVRRARDVAGLPGAAAGGRALENARRAMTDLAQQVLDRAALAPLPADEADLEVGELAALDRAECLDLLRSRTFGRLAYLARAGVPDVAPVNYAVLGSDVLVRSGPGPKLQAAERRELVAFEVDDVQEDTACGWSVVVVGRAQRLTWAQVRFLPEAELPLPWATGPRHSVIRISPSRITGRRLG